tara:strand:+ start:2108 stop:2398 length:291 start_codon:yes stop_codon:yes gene_type:complete
MDIVARLEEFIKSKKISKSAFANQIGVQRSSIAHFFSGRNKPSLDFYIKIKEKYPEVDLNWIISGIKTKKSNRFSKSNQDIDSIIILFKDGRYEKR